MKNMKIRNWFSLVIFILLIAILQPACRREEEPLDKNRPPETYLTLAPPETLESNYRVHVYWYGEDIDGTVSSFIFHISDTVNTLEPYIDREAEVLDWNPASRKADYQIGQFTSRNDTVILFNGYDIETGNLRNRQAFHIAAVDDGGLIDETPARIQFFATAEGLPTIRYWVKKGDGDFLPYNPDVLDTVPLFNPLYFRFVGENANSGIASYRWTYNDREYPDANADGYPEWYIPEPGELIEVGPLNHAADSLLNSGDFFFRGIVRDSAGAISSADYITGEGLCQIVVNFDPITEIVRADNYFTNEFGNLDSTELYAKINEDSTQYEFYLDPPYFTQRCDTLPFGSWLRIFYRGWDHPNDILEFTDPPIHMRYKYMLEYSGYSRSGKLATTRTAFFPLLGNAEYTNPGDIDSTTMTIGTSNYTFTVRTYDEQYRYDNTPAMCRFYGNFQPTVDDMQLGVLFAGVYFLPFTGDTIYLGDPMDETRWNTISSGDTLFPSQIIRSGSTIGFRYQFSMKATGHDDNRDMAGSAIKSWNYWIEGSQNDFDFSGEYVDIFGQPDDEMTKDIEIFLPVNTSTGYPDADFVADLPSYMGQQFYYIVGYDMGIEQEYVQKIRQQTPTFDDNWNITDPGELYENSSNVSNYARSDTLSGSFYIKPLW